MSQGPARSTGASEGGIGGGRDGWGQGTQGLSFGPEHKHFDTSTSYLPIGGLRREIPARKWLR